MSIKSRLVELGFFAGTGIVLGAWEAYAKATRRVPTVSRAAATHRSARALAVAWSLGLAHHFLTHKPKV